MAKNVDKNLKKTEKNIQKLTTAYSDLLDDISPVTNKASTERVRDVDAVVNDLDEIIKQEIEALSDYTGSDISSFLVKLFNEKDNRVRGQVKNINDIFNADESAITNYFLEKQRDENIAFNELNMVATQLYELKEAILTTRDSIITSDDISQIVSRALKFDSGLANDDSSDISNLVKIVEAMEKKFKLPQKIKNFIVPNTLKYGRYYVYSIPYSDLFAQYAENKNKMNGGYMQENTVFSILENMNKKEKKNKGTSVVKEMSAEINKGIKENMDILKNQELLDKTENGAQVSSIEKAVESYLKNIEVNSDPIPIPILEGEDLAEYFEFKSEKNKKFKAFYDAEKRSSASSTKFGQEGIVSEKPEDYGKGDKNVYIKLIEPRKLLPIKILDEVIGYWYKEELDDCTLQPFSNTVKITNAAHLGRSVEDDFIHTLTDKIVKSFDKNFLNKNQAFKKLILNSLMYEDSYRKHLKFQFIPVDYITEFKVNEDENGNGQSILTDSLFYAKLYLAILIFKMIQVLTKSMDTRIYYVKNSGADTDVINGVQRVARQIKERQINYYDILNPNTSISKIGNNKEIFIPTGRGNERGIEFDILAGQDVQLNTDFMDMLRQGYINATGVPSVIMNYINEADYAKTLVMANSKFIGRVISYQSDFNSSITELYQKLMRWSTDIDETMINSFEYCLSTPRTLNNNNLNDLVGSTDQVIGYMVKIHFGENSSNGDDEERINSYKDYVIRELNKSMLPMLPWNDMSELEKKAIAAFTDAAIAKKSLENQAKEGEDEYSESGENDEGNYGEESSGEDNGEEGSEEEGGAEDYTNSDFDF